MIEKRANAIALGAKMIAPGGYETSWPAAALCQEAAEDVPAACAKSQLINVIAQGGSAIVSECPVFF